VSDQRDLKWLSAPAEGRDALTLRTNKLQRG
jgi:hypothetical protein